MKKNFATCLKVKATIFDDTPGAQKVHSPDFKQGTTTVSGTVEIDSKRSDIDNGWNTLSKSGFERCMQQLFDAVFTSAMPSGATVGDTTVTKFDVGVGSRSLGVEAKTSISYRGRSFISYIDFLLSRAIGRASRSTRSNSTNRSPGRPRSLSRARCMTGSVPRRADRDAADAPSGRSGGA